MTQPLAYPYYRWSDATQAAGDTLRRQSDAAVAYAAEHSLVLADPIQVEGVSAFKGRHLEFGALAQFLRRLEDGEVPLGSFLLVDSFDRLSREKVMAATHLLTGIVARGVVVVTLNNGHRYDSDSNMMMVMYALMEFARSHEESKEKGRKVRDALDEAKREARANLTPWSRAAPFWLDIGPDGQWCEKGDRYGLVRRVFDMKEGGLGNAAIARILNAEDIPPPRPRKPKKGKPVPAKAVWHTDTVGLLVTARTTIGEYQPHKNTGVGNKRVLDGPPIDGFYPKIINQAQFDRVQAIIASRQNPNATPRTAAFTNLLVGLVRCGVCGGTAGYWQGTRPKKPHLKPLGVIRCNRKNAGACDNGTRIKYDALEADLLPFVASLPIANGKAPDADDKAILTLEGGRLSLTAKINTLLDQLEGGGAIADRLRQRERELADLDAKVALLKTKAAQARAAIPTREALDALDALRRDMGEATGEHLYAIRAKINSTLRLVVTGGFVMDRDGKIVVRIPLDQAMGKIGLFSEVATGGRLRWEISNQPWAFGRDWNKLPSSPARRERPEDFYTPTSKHKN